MIDKKNTHRIKLLYDVPGWAYAYRCEALAKYAPPDFHVTIERGNLGCFPDDPQDLHLQLCYSEAARLRSHLQRLGQKSIIVTGCNTGWQNEGPREGRHHWDTMQNVSDWIIFNSRSAWGRAGQPAKSSWISNGVDREIFACRVPLEKRPPRVLWIGSFYHTEPKRDLKGYHSLLVPLKERLEARGIPCDWRRVDSTSTVTNNGNPHYSREEMVDWYNTGTIYVVTSQSEGTPNPALEAASCGCTLVSTLVGNMPELIEHGANGLLVERNLESVEAGVVEAVERYAQWGSAMQEKIAGWDWRIRTPEYYALFRRLLEKGGA